MNALLALVLLLQGLLHVKVQLTLSLDALLLNVTDNAGVHRGLFGFLLKVYEYNYAGGEEGCGGEGEFRCGRHDVFVI